MSTFAIFFDHMFLRLLCVSLALAAPLAGLAHPGQSGSDPGVLAAANPNASPAGAVEPLASADRAPQPATAGLSPDLVYAVLVAQIADQRGDHSMAFTHFLHAAQLSKDQELAERATRAALTLADDQAIQRAVAVWLDVAPDSMKAHQIAAYVRLQVDDVNGAMAHLRRLINLAADEGEDGFLQAARLVHKLRPAERRLQLMENLTSGEPENADAWFARALVAAGADQYRVAARAAERAAELRRDWTEPRVFLVQVLLDEDRRAEARLTLERFIAESPDDQGLRMLYAQLLVDEKEFSRARGLFELMLEEAPTEPDLLFALGILSLQLEDIDAGRAYFTRLRETGERQGDAAYYLGQLAELADNLSEATAWYAKVRGEHALDAKVRIARVKARGGEVEQAREMLQQLRDQWPEESVLLYIMEAELLSDLDLERDALAVYDEAVAAHTENTDLLYSRALHAASLQELEILESDLRAILADHPDHADALNALGYTLADQTSRYAEALSFIQRALELKPNDPAVLDSMGWVQYRMGNLEPSLGYLRKALDLLADGEIAAHLGEVLWVMGEQEEAWSVWEKALVLDPDHAYLLRVIGRHRVTHSDPRY